MAETALRKAKSLVNVRELHTTARKVAVTGSAELGHGRGAPTLQHPSIHRKEQVSILVANRQVGFSFVDDRDHGSLSVLPSGLRCLLFFFFFGGFWEGGRNPRRTAPNLGVSSRLSQKKRRPMGCQS